jgi:hypothetical protein
LEDDFDNFPANELSELKKVLRVQSKGHESKFELLMVIVVVSEKPPEFRSNVICGN